MKFIPRGTGVGMQEETKYLCEGFSWDRETWNHEQKNPS